MDMIEVDPKLFVTCRLCLEDLGQYQIVPSVQKQIKYCFDITVEPFDGLPQLICVKCKQILINFFAIKEKLCQKQAKLKLQVNKKITNTICVQPQQDAVSSSQQTVENSEEKISTTKSKRIIESSDSETSHDVVQAKKKMKSVRHKNVASTNWNHTGYKKYYTCRICTSDWPTKNAFNGHCRTHMHLKATYPTIFQINCTVNLKKIDDKPNLTGKNHLVVHSRNKITENSDSFYYIKYTKISDSSSNSESSGTDDEIITKPMHRRRRVLSRSSNDTVVIESNSNNAESDLESKPASQDNEVTQTASYQCINIDDSSDSDVDSRSQLQLIQTSKKTSEEETNVSKTIKGIVTLCVSSHYRKSQFSGKSDNIVDQLKHKILSIGRKILNRYGVNFTGIVKYLNCKHLDIIWAIKALPTNNNKESTYIRIMIRIRGKENFDDNSGWVPVSEHEPVPDLSLDLQISTLPFTHNHLQSISLSQSQDTAVLLPSSPPDPKNKLLNANPVANPKQLPKKAGQTGESRLNKPPTELSAFQNVEENSFMPIITSTKSLADPKIVEDNTYGRTPAVITPTTEKSAPRIKVKPVTELMSERTLQSLRNEQSTSVSSSIENINNLALNPIENTNNMVLNQIGWPQQTSNAYPSIHVVPLSCLNVTPATTLINPVTTQSPTIPNTTTPEEYVLLNTVELPNTKTDSPFKYLKSLLRVYNFILLDPHEILTQDFACIIKFKVQFKQEPIDEPVVLCLSLLNSKNRFCFRVKDRNHVNININKISPNWQWEILNVFRGDLVNKVLQNAQKYGQETRDFTNKFLCLLKSIKFSKLTS